MSAPETAKDRSKRWRSLLGSAAYFAVVSLVVIGVYLFSSVDESGPAPPATTSTTSPADTAEPGEEPVADAAEVILPSVVNIQSESGIGSGVVFSEDGLIVTAAHIVEGSETVLVRFLDGKQIEGEVIGIAAEVDVAVIRVARTDLVPATFSDDKPRVGQLAVAVGSPFTLESTVTAGIISAVDRTNCPDRELCLSMLQTDAAINPGNSGGALVNRYGEVVGINVSIFSQSGSNEGVGFALPSETVIRYVEDIVAGRPLETALLGVRGGFATGDRAGAIITEVQAGTGAEAAGLMVDDVVISIDGVIVQGIDDLAAQVRAHRPGDTVTLVLLRDGVEMSLDVILGVRSP